MLSRVDEEYYADDTLGGRLVFARENAAISLVCLSERLGVSVRQLRDWEADRSAPQTDQLVRMAELFDVKPLWLMSGDTGSGYRDIVNVSGRTSRPAICVLGPVKSLRSRH